MTETLITSTGWLEPLLPDNLPDRLLSKADDLRTEAGRLEGMLSGPTAHRVGKLLRLTNSYYSNLIEGHYTQPADFEAAATRRSPKRPTQQLLALAVAHVRVQAALERLEPSLAWSDSMSPGIPQLVHRHLFQGAPDDELRLANGQLMTPGELRKVLVEVGQHLAPVPEIVLPMLERMQRIYGGISDNRLRLLAAFAYHHRLAWVHPFADGNGRVVRMVTHLHLHQLGFASPLWSLSRGIARNRGEYYDRLANADAPRRSDLDGRGQLSRAALTEFIEFMLDTCLDQVRYMTNALSLSTLRDRLEQLIGLNVRLREARVRPESARALQMLLTHGSTSRADFKAALGLGERLAISELQILIRLGLVESPTPRSREIYPGLPVWFAQELFPDLHKRFQ